MFARISDTYYLADITSNKKIYLFKSDRYVQFNQLDELFKIELYVNYQDKLYKLHINKHLFKEHLIKIDGEYVDLGKIKYAILKKINYNKFLNVANVNKEQLDINEARELCLNFLAIKQKDE